MSRQSKPREEWTDEATIARRRAAILGTANRGPKNALWPDQCQSLREEWYAGGVTVTDLADRYSNHGDGVHEDTIRTHLRGACACDIHSPPPVESTVNGGGGVKCPHCPYREPTYDAVATHIEDAHPDASIQYED